jgi:hypothetical protein
MILCSLICAISPSFLMLQDTPKKPLQKAEQPTSLTRKVASPQEANGDFINALNQFFEKYPQANVVCDLFYNENLPKEFKFNRDGSMEEAIESLAKATGRSVEKKNNIFILHLKASAEFYVNQDKTIVAGISVPQRNESSVLIKKHTSLQKIDAPLQKLETLESPIVYYSLLTESGGPVSLSVLARTVSRETDYPVRVASDISKRRVILKIAKGTIPEIMEAVSYCVNLRPEILLRQSEEQSTLEKLKAEYGIEALRVKPSAEIYKALTDSLTPEQKQKFQEKLANGEFVEWRLNTMPANIQGKVIDYLNLVNTLAGKEMSLTPDWNKINNFGVRFSPDNIKNPWLGVMITGSNGVVYCF